MGVLRRFWSSYAWIVIAVASLVAFALTALGTLQVAAAAGTPIRVTDAAYAGLAAFVLNGPNPLSRHAPLALEIGRFLAPLTVAAAAVEAFSRRLGVLFDRTRIRRLRDHTIIVGLSRAGVLLAGRLAETGERVAVVELDPLHPLAPVLRSRGVMTLFADAAVARNLEAAGIRRAKRLVAVAGPPARNAAIASAVTRALARPGPKVRSDFCSYIEIDDPDALYDLHRAESETGADHRQEFFGLHERAAHLLVDQSMTDILGARAVVISGGGAIALDVITRLAREWHVRLLESTGQTRLRIDVLVDGPAEEKRVRARVRSELGRSVDLAVHQVDDTVLADDLRTAATVMTAGPVLVTDDDAVRRLRMSLAIRLDPTLSTRPRIVVADSATSLEALTAGDGASRLLIFPDAVCNEEYITWGRTEDMARSIHERYLRHVARLSPDEQSSRPANSAWGDLDDTARQQNVAAASALLTMLRDHGYRVVPLEGISSAETTLPDAVVEKLAETEHERWRAARSEDAEPWATTSANNQELTRAQVQQIPAVLAFAGLAIAESSARP